MAITTALEYVIKVNTADARANLSNFRNTIKSELDKSAGIDVKFNADQAKQQAIQTTQAISSGFKEAKARASELYETQKNVVASLQLMGKTGTREFAVAQAELQKTRLEAEKFDKALQTADVQTFGEKLRGIGSAAASIAGPLGLVGGAFSVGGILQATVEMDKATGKIRTLGGAAREIAPDLQKMSLQLSRDIPIAATEMQNAAYDALSAGINASTSDMQAFMDTAGKLAVGGGETVANTVNLLSSVVNAYGMSASDAASASDILFTTVNLGKTTIPELNQSMSQVIPTAAAMGVNLENVGASLALMTANGVPTAQATTRLNMLLNELRKPSEQLAPILTKAGVSMKSLASEGLPATLEKITNQLKTLGIDASSVFSSIDASSAFDTLTKNSERFQDTLNQFQSSAGATEFAFGAMGETGAISFEALKANIQEIAINVGSQLLPTIKSTVDVVGSSVVFLSKNLDTLAPPILAVVVATKAWSVAQGISNSQMGIGIATSIAHNSALGIKATVTGVATVATHAFNAAMKANPLGAVFAAVTLLIGGITALVNILHKSSEEQLEQNKEMQKTIETQKKDVQTSYDNVESKKKLIDEYIKLGKESNKTAEEQKRFEELQRKLNEQYPELRLNTQNFAQDLGKLEAASQNATNKMITLGGQLSELNKTQLELAREGINIQANIYKDQAVKTLQDVTGFWDVVTDKQQKGLDQLQTKMGEIYGKKSKDQIDNVIADYREMAWQLINTGVFVKDKQKQKLIESIDDVTKFGQERINYITYWDNKEKEQKETTAKAEIDAQKQVYEKLKKSAEDLANIKSVTEKKSATDMLKTQLETAKKNVDITVEQYNEIMDIIIAQGEEQKKSARDKLNDTEKQMLKDKEAAQKEQEAQLKQMQDQEELNLKARGLNNEKVDQLRMEGELLELYKQQKKELEDFKIGIKTAEGKKEVDKWIADMTEKISNQEIKVQNIEIDVEEANVDKFIKDLEDKIAKAKEKIQISVEFENYTDAINGLNLLTANLKDEIELLDEQNQKTENISKIAENNAKKEENLRAIQKADREKEYYAELDRISKIADDKTRQIEQERAEAKKKYDDENSYADISFRKLLELRIDLNKKMQEADNQLAGAQKSVYQDAFESIGKGFADFKIELPDDSEAKEQLKKEEEDALDSYKRRESSILSYNQKLNEIDKRRNEMNSASSKGFWDSVNKALAAATADLYKSEVEKLQASLDKRNELNEKQQAIQDTMNEMELQKQAALNEGKLELAKKYEEDLKNLKQEEQATTEAQAKVEQDITAEKIVMYSSYFSQVLAENKKMGKSAALTAIKMLQAEAPIYVAEAIMKSFANNPILGAVLAAVATSAIYAALAMAQGAASKMNFKTGVVALQGPGTETSDSIPANLSKGESILTARATNALGNAEFFRWANKNNGNIYDYVAKNDNILQKVIEKTEYKLIRERELEKIYSATIVKLQYDDAGMRAEFKKLTEDLRAEFRKQTEELGKNLNYNFKNRKIAEVYNNNKIEQKIVVNQGKNEIWR